MLVGTATMDGSEPSNGNTLPQVKRPWGFNDWVPQTKYCGRPWWFVQDHMTFEGIRCTHQPSPWINDYGYFSMLPITGPALSRVSTTHLYSHARSVFKPHYFRTELRTLNSDIDLELTPTNHAAALRITFAPESENPRLVLNFLDGNLTSPAYDRLEGYTNVSSGGISKDWKMHIVAKVQEPSDHVRMSVTPINGTIEFGHGTKSVVVVVATSFISIAQAWRNLDREVGDKSFDELVAEGKAEWRKVLGVYNVTAIDTTALKVFYTNVWKASLFPRFLTESNESGHDVHFSPYTNRAEEGKLVADSGFWDAYRTVYTFQSMAHPEILGALMEGWVNAYREAEWLPQWPSPGQRASMVGTMGDVSLADAIVKSEWGFVSGFNVSMAYEAIRKDAFTPRPKGGLFGRAGLQPYVNLGYIPEADFPNQANKESNLTQVESVSRTLNDYVADAAISRAAAVLDFREDNEILFNRSRKYPVLFNKTSLFFQPKDVNGSFYGPFDPLAWRWGFTEGGPWQYRFYVPHDVAGLQVLYDGQLCAKIKEMLTTTSGPAFHQGGYGGTIHEMKEAQALFDQGFGYYAHNNQPVHHVLWIAKKAGCDDIGDQYLRRTMAEMYTLKGYPGDEDNGEMAAWYVLSALGLFQLENAADELVVGSPAVVDATLQLAAGKRLTITTENQSQENVHVQSTTWTSTGGSTRTVKDNILKFTEVMAGGNLHFVLGDKPALKSQNEMALV